MEPVAELAGHSERAWQSAWSPAHPTIASCSTDKSVRLYTYTPFPDDSAQASASSPTLPKFSFKASIPTTHSRTVRALAFNPSGNTLATASFDATIGIWQRVREHGIDDGSQIVSGDDEDEEWETIDSLEGHENECKSVAWSHDGKLIATCGRDKSVWVWEAGEGGEFECLAVLMDHSQDVKMVAWHPTLELLASASYDDTVKIYAADPYDDEWSCIQTLEGHESTVWSLAFSPCGRYLATAGDDLVIKIWGRDKLSARKDVGELGEAVRQDGGRMGPWSAGGVRIGEGEKWRWALKSEISDSHTRSIYSIDWGTGGESAEHNGIGRLASVGGDGVINLYQMSVKAVDDESDLPAPTHRSISQVEDAHGVFDINHVSWCKLSPQRASASVSRLQDGAEDEDAEDDDDTAAAVLARRWRGCEDLLATAGDDGLVKVWRATQ